MKDPEMLGYTAIDDYGEIYHLGPTKHPRRALLEMLDATHAQKVYTDTKDGTARHIGYLIKGRWFTLYRMCAWKA